MWTFIKKEEEPTSAERIIKLNAEAAQQPPTGFQEGFVSVSTPQNPVSETKLPFGIKIKS